MELLGAFHAFRYPNEIGPGVYDIHSPRVPSAEEMLALLEKALAVLTPEQLWVNPDCGLKTRQWKETEPALVAMVDSASEESFARRGHRADSHENGFPHAALPGTQTILFDGAMGTMLYETRHLPEPFIRGGVPHRSPPGRGHSPRVPGRRART